MSQLQQVGHPSHGTPQKRIDLTWSDFVQLALDLTVQAYQEMRHEQIVRQDWKEDQFTVNLVGHLQPIARMKGVFVNRFGKVITEDMKAGNQSVKEANKFDL